VSVLDGALRAHADGDLCAEAAARLLIAGRWLDRDDFAGRFVTVAASPGNGTEMAVIDWPAAAGALGRTLPCSGGFSELNSAFVAAEKYGDLAVSACEDRVIPTTGAPGCPRSFDRTGGSKRQ
jgi:hypothetical protein